MKMLERLQKKEASLAVVGLGYVGLPLAVAFGEKFKTIGFDINERKITLYREGLDPTHEVGNQLVKDSAVEFTADPAALRRAAFIIIAVPTPIHADKTPDLLPLLSACRLVGENLSPGSIVVFESTVYPGVTEEICLPLIEKTCGLQCGTAFSAGYSPERINPGDQEHRLENIKKLVAAVDDRTLAEISAVYNEIITAGVYPTASIKVAETAKLVENTQRDVNIAFMNEMAMFCARLGISTGAVLEAMNTKWNALKFTPGLVGGHCIGVDPWCFIYKAEMLGYHSPLVTGARKINDEMGFYVAEAIVKKLLQAGCNMQQAKIYILGVSYKENCPDVRNSKAWDIARRLREYSLAASFVDPVVDKEEIRREEGLEILDLNEVEAADCLVFLVGHSEFSQLEAADLWPMFNRGSRVVIDVKSIFARKNLPAAGFLYWSL